MARYIPNPNPYSKTLNQMFARNIIIIICILSGLALANWVTETKNLIKALFGYAILFLFTYAAIKNYKQSAKNDRGEDAEFEVRKILEKLSDDYAIFQDVKIRKKLDVDFILVGPTGVYAIEVKSYRKSFLFGQRDFISQALGETMALKNYLEISGISNVYINAILVYTKGWVGLSFRSQRGVTAMAKESLLPFINSRREVNFDKVFVENLTQRLYARIGL
jgi:hypothetical protein